MDLNQLKTFLAIAREGSLVKASSVLHLSQPALSAQLKSLEEELGLLLFERTAKKMQLTQAAEVLLPAAQAIIDSEQALLNHARMLQENLVGCAQIGTVSEPAGLPQMNQFFAHMRSHYPQLKLHLIQDFSGNLMSRVLNGELHAAFVTGLQPSTLALTSHKLAVIEVCIVAPAAWAAKIQQADWHDIVQLPWIGTAPECAFSTLAKKMFMEKRVAFPKVMIQADQNTMRMDLIINEMGLAMMRVDQARAALQKGDIVVWHKGQIQTHLNLIYLTANAQHPVVAAILNLAKTAWLFEPSGMAVDGTTL